MFLIVLFYDYEMKFLCFMGQFYSIKDILQGNYIDFDLNDCGYKQSVNIFFIIE